ncbi:hypothetical protein SAMN05518683_11470 [Salibacterium halotolerans]|uniref:Uncharacterized protein n=1 Tax=Salibacterium halotolerans TaxID=1884432 RepID=A0A1I5UVA6_9BACI|nr:hypothetical protein SAMN05518683_11470 [Salibacterium halotolerans]
MEIAENECILSVKLAEKDDGEPGNITANIHVIDYETAEVVARKQTEFPGIWLSFAGSKALEEAQHLAQEMRYTHVRELNTNINQ